MNSIDKKTMSIRNMRDVSSWFFKSVVCGERLGSFGASKLSENVSVLRKLSISGDLPDHDDFIKILMSNIRKDYDRSALPYSKFEKWWNKGVMGNVSLQQGSANRASVVCGHMHDLITSDVTCDNVAGEFFNFSEDGTLKLLGKTAIAKAVSAYSDKVERAANKKDPAYSELMKNEDFSEFSVVVDSLDEVIQKSWSKMDFGNSKSKPLTDLQIRLTDFTDTITKAVSTSDAMEILAWVQTAVLHKDFNLAAIIAKGGDDRVDKKQTLENVYEFANQISPSVKEIFSKQRYTEQRPRPLSSRSDSHSAPSYRFSRQPASMPDVFFMEDGELKIAYASTSRDTTIERNQFIRHSLEAGFYNVWLKDNLNEFERLDNSKVSGALRNATSDLKCDKDSMMWFRDGYNTNDIDNFTAYTKKILNDAFVKNPSIGSESEVLAAKSAISEFSKLGQVARNTLYVRLVGIKNGERDLNELLVPELTDKDLTQLLSKDKVKFFTRACDERVRPFLYGVDPERTDDPVLKSVINELKSADEETLFRGLQRMAFRVTQDSHSEFKIDGGKTAKILNNIEFVTGVAKTDTALENKLAHKFMTLLALSTKEPSIMQALINEMGDVSVVSEATLQKSAGGKLYSSGLYQQERSNIMRSVSCVSNEIRKSLVGGNEIDGMDVRGIMERYFGDDAGSCHKVVMSDGLIDLAENLSQVRLADSESTEVLDGLCSAADSASFRIQRALKIANRNDKHTFTI